MRKAIQFAGLVMIIQGVSGAIDHVAVQPFFGTLFNFFNRVIIPRVDLLAGHVLFTDLVLAVLGAVLVIAAERTGRP